jgi:hypothetical protein
MRERLAQYSVVSYVHPLRGERVNLGVIVWHPQHGIQAKFLSGLARVNSVDEHASTRRVREELAAIERTLDEWKVGDRSPLPVLASEFQHKLVVAPPANARAQDPVWMLERLTTLLLPPTPFHRASSAKQFGAAFAREMKEVLRQADVQKVKTNFEERRTFRPILVAVAYRLGDADRVWRVGSFATAAKVEDQVTIAKALHAENHELRRVEPYRDAELNVAVQLPKPSARRDFPDALAWLGREVDRVEVFEDRESIASKVPEIAL